MNLRLRILSRKLCLRPACAPAWLVLVLPCLIALAPHERVPDPWRGLKHSAWVTEEATPDSEADLVEPFPARARLRLFSRLGVDRWHAAGVRGRGVTVAAHS